jgi:heavy metal efflux system protein
MSTAFGEVFQYTVSAPKLTLMQIKTLHDWVIRYALLSIPGVMESAASCELGVTA